MNATANCVPQQALVGSATAHCGAGSGCDAAGFIKWVYLWWLAEQVPACRVVPCRWSRAFLVMARLNQILDLDPVAGIARVQPGVRNIAISQAAQPFGLYYAPDPSSQIACSIGGNVAENAGGVHCLKYGLTVHNILRPEVITVTGERLTLGSESLDAPGFDLMALFTGSEGMLGIVTEITVKLLARPPCTVVLLASFDDVEKQRIPWRRLSPKVLCPLGWR